MRTWAGWRIAIAVALVVLGIGWPKDVPAAAQETLDRIAFSSNRSGTAQIYVMNADGSGQTRLTNSSPFDDMQPDWSPDGRRIAFSRGNLYQSANIGSSSIVVMDAGGGNERVLAAEAGINFRPAWSPDGQRILYIHGSATQAPFDVWVVNADGTGKHVVTTTGDNNPAAWSSDGSQIVFGTTALDIWIMNADGSGRTRLTTTVTNYTPNWAPTNRIVFTSTRHVGAKQVYVMDPDGRNQIRLADDGSENKFPAWSPDGSRIAYSRSTVPCVGAECSSTQLGGYEIYVMNADGSGQTRITNTIPPGREFGNGYPAYAPRVEPAAIPSAQSPTVESFGQILPATGSAQLPLAVLALWLVVGGATLLRSGKPTRHKILVLTALAIAMVGGSSLPAWANHTGFTKAEYEVGESDGYVELIVGSSCCPTGSGQFDYHTADLTAIAGADYQQTSGTVTTAACIPCTIRVPIIGDKVFEREEQFEVILTNFRGTFARDRTSAAVRILDDDPEPASNFATSGRP